MAFDSNADLSGAVARLFIYPVKSCAGIEVQEALLTDTGLEFDRAWMVVDEQGAFLTQRAVPRMALIRPRIARDQGALLLQAPGLGELRVPLATDATQPLTPVVVWKDTVPAWDMGDEAAHWLTAFLGQPCRLVRFDPAQRRLSSPDWTGGREVPNQFSDGFPLLLTSTASLAGAQRTPASRRPARGGYGALSAQRGDRRSAGARRRPSRSCCALTQALPKCNCSRSNPVRAAPFPTSTRPRLRAAPPWATCCAATARTSGWVALSPLA